MARNGFSTGANMRGIVDVVANSVSLVEPTEVNDIRNILYIIQGLKLLQLQIMFMTTT